MNTPQTTGAADSRMTAPVIGWTEGDGSGHDGYHVADYFRDGRYLGPDEHGIEPIFGTGTADSAQHTPGLITGGGWMVVPHPLLAGKSPHHASRFVMTRDAQIRIADPNPDIRSWQDWDRAWELENGVIICEMRDSSRQAANARLIAAAPDLLAALAMLADWADQSAVALGDDHPLAAESDWVISAARAAIFRAKLEAGK
jgi:hypothetical protein